MKLSEFISKYGDCEVTEEMEKFIEKPKGKWEPSMGEDYFCLDSCGDVIHDAWIDSDIDAYRRNFLRIFKTSKEAERYREIMKACKEASFEPDWRNGKQDKYILCYEYIINHLGISNLRHMNSGELFYFKTYEIAQELIERFGEKDIAKYVLGVEVE